MPGSASTFSVARPAAAETGLPLKVPDTKVRCGSSSARHGFTVSSTSARPQTAALGWPPEIVLP